VTVQWSDPAYQMIANVVRTRTGLSLATTRCVDVEAGIGRAMARRAIRDVSRYLALLESDAVPLDDLIVELTVGETYFFRDKAHFDFIRHAVLPEVLRRRGPESTIRVWSAACATGEEAYSLASVLDEAGVDGHVLATDISRAALQKARTATYRPWSLRGVDGMPSGRFFSRTGDDWIVERHIQRRVTFQFHNLAESPYPSIAAGIWGMDLILCRNVLIYFDKAAVARVAEGLYHSLADDGWLITGPSDPPLDALAPFATVVTEAGVFYRRLRLAAESETGRRVFAPGCFAGARATAVGAADATPTGGEAGGGEASRLPEASAGWEPPASRFSSSVSRSDPLVEAQQALAAGDYDRALALTDGVSGGAGAILRVRAMASGHGAAAAAREAQRWSRSQPLSPELHILQGVLLMQVGDHEQAARALKRALYLDRSLAIANFLLGSACRRLGRSDDARRAYRNARNLTQTRPPDEPVAFADGQQAGSLTEAAESEMMLLDGGREALW
jgi:chemotaxis protein methyltransferase CheR